MNPPRLKLWRRIVPGLYVSRIDAALACLRGHSVVYRCQLGSNPADVHLPVRYPNHDFVMIECWVIGPVEITMLSDAQAREIERRHRGES